MRNYQSWADIQVRATPDRALHWLSELQELHDSRPVLAHGQGRSYGDCCLNTVASCSTPSARPVHRLRYPDRILRCEAGVSLDAILRLTVRRAGSPGNPGHEVRHSGRAIANDVHGRSPSLRFVRMSRHSDRGSAFDGERVICTPHRNAALFCATIGGLG